MRRALTALFLIAALTGCATRWVVDSDVHSFSKLDGVAPGATYRFDRLPSQQAQETSQGSLEAMAAPALDAVGLRRDEAAPRYAVQIGARVSAELSPWADPWYDGPGPWGWGPRRPGWGHPWYGPRWPGYGGWYGPAFAPPANPWYVREVSIVMRELPSNQVVYETRARNDGPYASSRDVLPVMFRAALQGFPNPPQGVRRVDLEIPRAQKSP